jgi:hypothetical protein
VGRHSEYSEEVADEICDRLANAESLRKICMSEGMPRQATVFRWLADERYASFRERYACAREAQAHAMADEILDIADDGANDFMGEDEKYNGDAVQRSKLRVDARKWLAAKLLPTKYGERTLVGSDPENPLPAGFAVNLVKRETD